MMTPSHRRLLHMIAIAAILMMPDLVGAQGTTRKVMDMEKREVTLPAQIRKVATIGSVPPLNSLIFAMGAGDMLVNGLSEPFARGARTPGHTVRSNSH